MPHPPTDAAAVADAVVPVAWVERGKTLCTMALAWPPEFANARAGQFAMIKSARQGAPLLPRPISLVPAPKGLHMVFNIVGEGTRTLADAVEEDDVIVIGPLGNSFTAPQGPITIIVDSPHAGTMLALASARAMAASTREPDTVLFVTASPTPHPSDEGVRGALVETGAAVIDVTVDTLDAALRAQRPTYIAAGAGNRAMERAQRFAELQNISGEASLQSPMACGLGACKVCIHPARQGPPFLVCEGPIVPLSLPDFGTQGEGTSRGSTESLIPSVRP
ncbi:MAG: hypothetical protein AAGJ94_11125 [Pseudomonadota bacterium]